MATLPQPPDPTLEAADQTLEARDNAEPLRPYLGMSEIGRLCRRGLWLRFRWCAQPTFDAATLKRFEDGHRGEALQAECLQRMAGIILLTADPRTGQQFECRDLGGHFQGHLDGTILGLRQAPKTWHVWEHKQVDEKKQRALEKAKREHGEKPTLAAWDGVYYAQAVLYMDYSDLTRHYLTCPLRAGATR
jgi:hypothetical protein